jgi:hypothetical protein
VDTAHYYLQAPKEGWLLSRSNYQKHVDFTVTAKMVMSLWRKRKLSHEMAKAELVFARDRAHVHLQEISKLQREEAERRQEAALKRKREALPRRAFLPPLDVELQWLRQYPVAYSSRDSPAAEAVARSFADAPGPHRPPALHRFRVLVYDGPSRTGKTMRAIHWFGEDRTLILNCQNTTSPCLRSWTTGNFDAILYDEASWELLWAQRKLFQAGPHPVQLSQSQCNESLYEVNVFAAPMIVCSNTFWQGCKDEAARAWLQENIAFVPVLRRCWQAEED